MDSISATSVSIGVGVVVAAVIVGLLLFRHKYNSTSRGPKNAPHLQLRGSFSSTGPLCSNDVSSSNSNDACIINIDQHGSSSVDDDGGRVGKAWPLLTSPTAQAPFKPNHFELQSPEQGCRHSYAPLQTTHPRGTLLLRLFQDLPVQPEIAIVDTFDIPDNEPVELAANIDGHFHLLKEYVATSTVLSWNKTHNKIVMKESGIVIFGGNAVGSGLQNRVVVNMLMELKLSYPKRVYLLTSAKEISRLRFPSEIGSCLKTSLGDLPDVNEAKVLACQILQSCLDVPDGFEKRQQELGVLGLANDDRSVVQSFIDDVDPNADDPWLLRYIYHSSIGLIAGNFIVTVGPLRVDCIGIVPHQDMTLKRPDVWINALGSFFREELDDYVMRPQWEESLLGNERGGQMLIDYASKDGFEGQSILDTNYDTDALSSPQLKAWLKATKLTSICSTSLCSHHGKTTDLTLIRATDPASPVHPQKHSRVHPLTPYVGTPAPGSFSRRRPSSFSTSSDLSPIAECTTPDLVTNSPINYNMKSKLRFNNEGHANSPLVLDQKSTTGITNSSGHDRCRQSNDSSSDEETYI